MTRRSGPGGRARQPGWSHFVFTRAYTDLPSSSRLPARFAGQADPQRGLRRRGRARARAGAKPEPSKRRHWPRPARALLQIDEPFLHGYPEDVALAVRGDQPRRRRRSDALGGARVLRQPLRPTGLSEFYYRADFLFPAILDAHVDQLVLEFARKGYDDLEAFRRLGPDAVHARPRCDRRQESRAVETADQVAACIPGALRRPSCRTSDREPRLWSAPPARRGGPGQAARAGGRDPSGTRGTQHPVGLAQPPYPG